jgi:hypothetical protein
MKITRIVPASRVVGKDCSRLFQSFTTWNRHEPSIDLTDQESGEGFLTVLVKHGQEFLEVDWLGQIALESAAHRSADLFRQCVG